MGKVLGILVAVTGMVPFSYVFADGWDRWGLQSQTETAIAALPSETVASFSIPVLLGVELNNLTRNFGDARDGGVRSHEGLDIMASKGTPIASPTDAVVLRTGDGAGSGLYVRTANPGGETFVYMHLSEIAKGMNPGTVLKRGDILGFVGNTGNASGGASHLHFEVRSQNGVATDPYPRLSQTFSQDERIRGLAQVLERTVDANLPATLATRFSSYFGTVGVPEPVVIPTAVVIQNPVPMAPVGTVLASGNPLSFSRNLKLGSQGEDVRALQMYLNAHGFLVATIGTGSPGLESDYFGARTQAALARYQMSLSISPAVGFFGPITRTRLASL